MDFRAHLTAEFERRRKRNGRYSLRAFARSMSVHHSTLSQLIQQRRRLTPRAIRQLGPRLGLTPAQVQAACLTEHCNAIKRLVRDPRFRANSRAIAVLTGIPIDDVNRALNWLLYRGELRMAQPDTWILLENQCPTR